ncbi:hypothetical protein THAOC_10520 [Thalassiosira oceanica]|uniref:Uncharacterized protein n=1 Tax=Thalassiosira oceanica TaxID=159749 RepID=K0TCU3_THAOC|nr:hypothetical protein THAOC_10520 [Thalassiosira oceanica]|eukprot:EJK68312.1 hypothetical protein THAOC_10520 [Thalassiosira oceanica]
MSVMGQHSSTQVSARDIRQIFSASQNDAEDEAVLQKVNEVDNISHHHQLMSFSEWLESICRLGVLKFSLKKKVQGEDEGDGHVGDLHYFDCIKKAIEMVCEDRAEATENPPMILHRSLHWNDATDCWPGQERDLGIDDGFRNKWSV